jgi:hypothetical protein
VGCQRIGQAFKCHEEATDVSRLRRLIALLEEMGLRIL